MTAFSNDKKTMTAELIVLAQKIACKVHNTWMEQRMSDGWVYGENRDKKLKTHPNIKPYIELPELEKIYDELTAKVTMQCVLDAGFNIVTQKLRTHRTPPTIPSEIIKLEEKIAEKVHDNWMQQRIKHGWSYGETLDDVNKLHPNIVSYEKLNTENKELDRITVREVLFHVLQAGYCILPTRKKGTSIFQKLKYARYNLAHFRDYLITDGGLRHLAVFSLPALSCFIFSILIFSIFIYSENTSIIQEIFSSSSEVARENHMAENIRGILFHLLDPGYLYYNMREPVAIQIFAFIVTVLGMIFVNGLLISTIVSFIARQRDRAEKGHMTYAKLENHVVLVGYSDMSLPIINKVLNNNQDNNKYPQQVLILTSKDMDSFRSFIFSQINNNEEYRVIFYSGSYESKDNLNRLCLAEASSIYVLGENNTLGRDSKNIETLHRIAEIFLQSSSIIRTNIYLQYDRISSSSIAHHLDFQKNIFKKNNIADHEISFYTYNFYENWARLLWGGYQRWSNIITHDNLNYASLDRDELCDDNYVHLIIIGFNRMGRALLLQALRVCHYHKGKDTRITIIDSRMAEKRRFFEAQYPQINEQISDIHIEYRESWAEAVETRQFLKDCAEDVEQVLTIAVCVRDADIALAIGLNLPESVYFQYKDIEVDNKQTNDEKLEKYTLLSNNSKTQILIRQEIQGGMTQQLDVDKSRYKNVRCFGMLNGAYNPIMVDDTLGMFVCDNYYAIKTLSPDALGDSLRQSLSMGLIKERLNWQKETEINRWANRYQVDMFDFYYRSFVGAGVDSLEKLNTAQKAINYIMKEKKIDVIQDKLQGNLIYELAQAEHRRWVAERSIMGWRQFKPESGDNAQKGERRIDSLLIHNLIIDFEQLPMKEKFKDINPVINSFVMTQVYTEYLMNHQ